MGEMNPTQRQEHMGARSSRQMGISPLGSIRVRIIGIAMLAIVSVSITQIIIFGSMSRQQFKDMVMCYMGDLADSYQKTMNIRVADLAEEGKLPDAEFWEEMVGGLDIMGMDGSYAYIVDRNGTMCYHPTASRIGS